MSFQETFCHSYTGGNRFSLVRLAPFEWSTFGRNDCVWGLWWSWGKWICNQAVVLVRTREESDGMIQLIWSWTLNPTCPATLSITGALVHRSPAEILTYIGHKYFILPSQAGDRTVSPIRWTFFALNNTAHSWIITGRTEQDEWETGMEIISRYNYSFGTVLPWAQH